MVDIKVNPTGCPGPLAGTKAWRCDGEDCVYGPYQYDCCKESIAERGYQLMLTSEVTRTIVEESTARRATLQDELARAQVATKQALKERDERDTALQQEQAKQQTLADDAAYLADCYAESLLANERTRAYLQTVEAERDNAIASLAELEEQSIVTAAELAAYRDKERWYEQERATMGAQDSATNSDADSGDSGDAELGCSSTD